MAHLAPNNHVNRTTSWLRSGLCVGIFFAAFVVLADWNPLPAVASLLSELNQQPATPTATVAESAADAEVVLEHFVYTASSGATGTKNGNTYSASTSLTETDYSKDDSAWQTYLAEIEAAAKKAYGSTPVTITILIKLSSGQTVSVGYTT